MFMGLLHFSLAEVAAFGSPETPTLLTCTLRAVLCFDGQTQRCSFWVVGS